MKFCNPQSNRLASRLAAVSPLWLSEDSGILMALGVRPNVPITIAFLFADGPVTLEAAANATVYFSQGDDTAQCSYGLTQVLPQCLKTCREKYLEELKRAPPRRAPSGTPSNFISTLLIYLRLSACRSANIC